MLKAVGAGVAGRVRRVGGNRTQWGRETIDMRRRMAIRLAAVGVTVAAAIGLAAAASSAATAIEYGLAHAPAATMVEY
jgi:hypothetical protein